MLFSIGLILLLGLCFSEVFKTINLPGLLGMILAGILIGPSLLNWVDPGLIQIAPDIRQMALIIILTRAGLSLDFRELKKIGRPALCMSFIPALFEICAVAVLSVYILKLSFLEGILMGTVLAAVSPAVVVPRMIQLKSEGYGKKHSVPSLIMAGSSADDIFVIVLFYSFLSLLKSGSFQAEKLLEIPVSILAGIVLGLAFGYLAGKILHSFLDHPIYKALFLLGISFMLLEIENRLKGIVPVSALLAVLFMAIMISQNFSDLAGQLQTRYNSMWKGAEIFLFVLVGVAVNIRFAFKQGILPVLVILLALCFRMMGVLVCLIKTNLTKKERIFCMLAYTPKATVQAGIGAIALSEGLACGSMVLTTAVLAILITAPLGALCIDKLHARLLKKE